jgi:hypothetical protein
MIINNNLLGIFNAMIKNKEQWEHVTDKQKEEFCFIINRYFSKKYTEQALLLNTKGMDKALTMDLWYLFMLKKPYPSWFWSKAEKSEKSDISEKEIKSLISLFKVKHEDIIYLIDKHPDFIKEELTWIKKLEKGN